MTSKFMSPGLYYAVLGKKEIVDRIVLKLMKSKLEKEQLQLTDEETETLLEILRECF